MTMQKQPLRASTAAFIGTMIEWYDFYIYALASALIFGQLFFKTESVFIGTMAAFATFAIGLIIRPLGGIIFGHIGDKIGRKKSLIITLFLMGFATVGIGLLPTYAQVGIYAPILLIILRMVQGVAVGGEWGGAVLIAAEHAPRGRRAFFASFAQLGSPAGLILATLAFRLISSMPPEAFMRYGWRLPFLASFILLIVGFIIRKNVNESPEFLENKQRDHQMQHGLRSPTKIPLVVAFKQAKNLILLGIGANVLGIAGFYFTSTFMVAYTTQYLHLERQLILDVLLLVSVIHFFNTPIAAWIGEKIGARYFLLLTSAMGCLTPYLMFMLVDTGHFSLMTIGIALPVIFLSAYYAVIAGYISGLFPTAIRYTGISMSYQICGAIAGGLTPLFATYLAQQFIGQWWPLALFFSMICMISFYSVWRLHPSKYTTY